MVADSYPTKKHRSPAYPALSLESAIDKAAIFYKAQKVNAVHVDTAVETMGYKIKSGDGLRAIAALIAFGLMSDEGRSQSRKVRLTNLALSIILPSEDTSARNRALRTAALSPMIYKDMAQEWRNGLPSDAAMQKYLIMDKRFNPEAVAHLVRDFRATYDFADLGGGETCIDSGPLQENEFNDGQRSGVSMPDAPPGPGSDLKDGPAITKNTASDKSMRALSIPLSGGRLAYLNVPVRLSEADFVFLTSYLKLLKDAIISGETGCDSGPDGE